MPLPPPINGEAACKLLVLFVQLVRKLAFLYYSWVLGRYFFESLWSPCSCDNPGVRGLAEAVPYTLRVLLGNLLLIIYTIVYF